VTRPFVVMFQTGWVQRKHGLEWIRDEWKLYADAKWKSEVRGSRSRDLEHLKQEGVDLNESWWVLQMMNYYARANLLGLDTLRGRQAVLKAACVALDLCAIMEEAFGALPKPGVPSGYLVEEGEPVDLS